MFVRKMAFVMFGWSLVLVLLATGASALKVAIGVDSSTVSRGSSLWLNCSYDLEGQTLYSVRWYKGGIEFYRFTPTDVPEQKHFLLPGIKIDRHKTTGGDVFLSSVDKAAQDLYRCEVLMDAPFFDTAVAETELIVHGKGHPRVTELTTSRPTSRTMWLNCSYQLDDKEGFSLSWYKDGQLFYRVTTSGRSVDGVRQIPGISIDDQKSSQGNVLLRDVGKDVSGTYRCVVTSGPEGDLIDKKEMPVVVNDEPRVLSGKQEAASCPEPEEIDVSAKRRGKKIIITLYMDDD